MMKKTSFFTSISRTKFLIVFLCSVLTFGCEQTEPTKTVILKKQNGWKIEIIDTIHVDFQGVSLLLVDYNENQNTILGYDASLKSIIELDSAWNVINELYLEVDDHNGYGSQSFGLCYFRDSLIAVSGIKGFYLYSKNGELVKKINKPKDTYPNVSPSWQIFYSKDQQNNEKLFSPYFSTTSDWQPNVSNKYYESLHPLTSIDISDNLLVNKYIFFGRYPDHSIYLDELPHYVNSEVITGFNKTSNRLCLIHEIEPLLHIYDNNGKLIKSLNLRPDNFKVPDGVPNGEVDPSILRMIRRQNSRYIAAKFPNDSLIITQYWRGADTPKNNSRMKRYIQIILDEKIVSNDIEFKEPLVSLSLVKSSGELYFFGEHPNPSVTRLEPDGMFFYKARLTRN